MPNHRDSPRIDGLDKRHCMQHRERVRVDKLVIRGAREHNLKNVSVDLPRDALIVFTGLSGSGKSSLAFDTIFAEGQRRYVESLSAYARQFLGQLDKPDVDFIEGLSPAVSIDQKSTSRNPRSTVGGFSLPALASHIVHNVATQLRSKHHSKLSIKFLNFPPRLNFKYSRHSSGSARGSTSRFLSSFKQTATHGSGLMVKSIH